MTKQTGGEASRRSVERRGFLKGLSLVAGGAAGTVASVATGAEGAAETSEEQVRSRYQETDHVRRFYALNRL